MKGIFQRVEVWILLILVIGGVVFVLLTQRRSGPIDPVEEPEIAEVEETAPFQVEVMELRPESAGHWLLEMDVRYENESGAPLELTSPTAQLLTGDGEEVPAFFLAFAPPPVVAANSEQTVNLRYWLNEDQAEGDELWLKILEDRVEIDLQKNGKELVRSRNEQGVEASR